ncbi:MAG TPA: hypothetical protein PKY88_13025 [Anaerohalosphaeraceae bacterium]|nr:hypothetical protein [Anaerohalosphaeraceae bacterium]
MITAAETQNLTGYLWIVLLALLFVFFLHYYARISERFPFLHRDRFPPWLRFLLWSAEGLFIAAVICFIAPGPRWADSPYLLFVLGLFAFLTASEYLDLQKKRDSQKQTRTRTSLKRVLSRSAGLLMLVYFLIWALLFFRQGPALWLNEHPVFTVTAVLLMACSWLGAGSIVLSKIRRGKRKDAERMLEFIGILWSLSLAVRVFSTENQPSGLLWLFSDKIFLWVLTGFFFCLAVFFAFLFRRELKRYKAMTAERLNGLPYEQVC